MRRFQNHIVFAGLNGFCYNHLFSLLCSHGGVFNNIVGFIVQNDAAWSLDLSDATGSLESGKAADFVVVDGDAINIMRVGAAPVAAVVKGGRLVYGALPMDMTA